MAAMTFVRPVETLENLIAASTASVPELQKKTLSRPGTSEVIFSIKAARLSL